MRPLSCNNNTTTRLKRGPNPLSGVLILILIFFLLLFFFCILYFVFFWNFFFFFVLFIFVFFFFVFCIFFFVFCFLFIYLFIYFVFCIFFFLYLRLYVVPLGTTTTDHQVPRLQRGPNPLSGILIPRPPRDNHNKPSSPQATERSLSSLWDPNSQAPWGQPQQVLEVLVHAFINSKHS